MCRAKYGFDSPASTSHDGVGTVTQHIGCPPSGCGLNGSWLGQGFPFRELRTDGGCNAQGLHISSFTLGSKVLRPAVVNDVLQGTEPTTGAVYRGAQLKTAKMEIRYYAPPRNGDNNARQCQARAKENDRPDATYILTIQDVAMQPSWSECKAPCTTPPSAVPVYQFSVVNVEDVCNVELCQPGMGDHDHPTGAAGSAVMFTGDHYDDSTYEVSPSTDSGVFNIACFGTAISKLHMFGHSAAAAANGAPATTIAQRQTLLRLLTGDYCGAGTPFTKNGTPIRIDFGNEPLQPTAASLYPDEPSQSIDAKWTAAGAACVGMPRLSVDPANALPANTLLQQIHDVCETKGHPIALDCDHPVLSPTTVMTSRNPLTR